MLMAVLGHDLRTPLSAVIASAEYLARFVPDENVANIGTRIKSSGMRMVRMVDQLLNLARLRGGRVTTRPRVHSPSGWGEDKPVRWSLLDVVCCFRATWSR